MGVGMGCRGQCVTAGSQSGALKWLRSRTAHQGCLADSCIQRLQSEWMELGLVIHAPIAPLLLVGCQMMVELLLLMHDEFA